MLHWPGVPVDRITLLHEKIPRCQRQLHRHDRIEGTVQHQDRYCAVGLFCLGRQRIGQRQVGGQGEDTRQRPGIAQAGMQHDSPTLGKPGQHDTTWRDTRSNLAFNQRLQLLLRLMDAIGILAGAQIKRLDVVPGRHTHAGIDANRTLRRMRQYNPYAMLFDDAEVRDEWFEIMAVGTEPVQPDDAGGRGAGWIDLDCIEQGCFHAAKYARDTVRFSSLRYDRPPLQIGFGGSSTYTGSNLNRTCAMSIHYLRLLPLLLCLSGCGQTGPLYLPDKTAPPPTTSETPAPDDEQAVERRE